ncbi:hypothetical protein ACPCSC_17955 [Streptomyces lavendulocolor]|uniref:hypothetical protein n=1 Tax=Streptomyces lavendulocolor TaxID=67316 RepID=UPI003C2B4D0D
MDAKPPVVRTDADDLAALIESGGFWRLAPEWVPRTGYADHVSRDTLKAIEAGLRERL